MTNDVKPIQRRSSDFLLGAGKRERHEDDLRGRLGLLPKGATLPFQVKIYGWLITIYCGILAAALRFWRLDHPNAMVFDETYYVKGGYSMLNYGYERNWEGDNVNDKFVVGDLSGLEVTPDRWVHPPFGKWLIGQGMRVFGDDNGFGWRFTTAILGVASVMLLVRIALRLFRSLPLAALAGIFMAVDGMGIVLSRTGLLDNILAFFVLAGFWAVIKDRDRTRGVLAERVARGRVRLVWDGDASGNDAGPTTARIVPANPWAPPTFFRPWLIVAGILLGLACSVKWSGAYALAVFGILVFAWGAAARKAVDTRLWFGSGVVREGIPAFIQLVPTAVVTYIVAFLPWFLHPVGWDRQWAPDQQARNADLPPADQVPMPIEGAPDIVNSFIHWHTASWEFHTGLSEPHTYQSQAWQWPLQIRPVSFYWDGNDELPANSCPSDDCVAAITSVGNPFIWWLALAGLIIVVIMAFRRRDWRAWAIIAGYLAMWAPWLQYVNRTIFQFYAVAFLPFVVLALVYGLAWVTDMLQPTRTPARRVPVASGAVPVDVGAAASGTATAITDELAADDPVVLENGFTVRERLESNLMLRFANVEVPNKPSRILLGVVLGVILVASLFWYPIWTGISVPRWFWQLHMWLPTWI